MFEYLEYIMRIMYKVPINNKINVNNNKETLNDRKVTDADRHIVVNKFGVFYPPKYFIFLLIKVKNFEFELIFERQVKIAGYLRIFFKIILIIIVFSFFLKNSKSNYNS